MSDGKNLSPRLLQIVGVLLVVGSAIYWGVTGHESALLVGAGLSLAGLGAFTGVRISLIQGLEHEELTRDPSANGHEKQP